MKKIKEAAIIHDGVVFTGRRHYNVIRTIVDTTGVKSVHGEQGFVTEDGEFVNREEAGKIALACGQIEKLNWPPDLYSEDLY